MQKVDNYFRQNLKYLRKKTGETQASIASQVGKGYTTIGNWESGASQPNLEELVKVANYFGVSLDNIIKIDMEKGNLTAEIEENTEDEKGNLIGKQTGKVKHAVEAISSEKGDGKLNPLNREEIAYWAIMQELRRINEKLDRAGIAGNSDTSEEKGQSQIIKP